MIRRLHLENFQGHTNSVLDFHPGVNVIVGPSDVGKSSIIRALRWIVLNRPAGASDLFRNWHAKKGEKVSASVTMATETGKTFSAGRFQQGSQNGYEVDGNKLVAIKTGVPEEVSSALGMNEHNIQTQHQPYFLVADSPGDVARHLNEVCGLDIIDDCLSQANAWTTTTSADMKASEARTTELRGALAGYTNLAKREIAVSALEKLDARIADTAAKLSQLSELSGQLETVRGEKEQWQEFLKVNEQVGALAEVLRKITETKAILTHLIETATRLYNIRKDLGEERNLLDSNKANYEAWMKTVKICPVCKSKFHWRHL